MIEHISGLNPAPIVRLHKPAVGPVEQAGTDGDPSQYKQSRYQGAGYQRPSSYRGGYSGREDRGYRVDRLA